MYDRLKFCFGAVAERSVLAELSHFHFYNGRVQAGNGRISIDAAVPEMKQIEASVPASKFLAAIDACASDDLKIELKDERIIIRAGRFRAKVPVLTAEKRPPAANPDPPSWEAEEPLLPIFKRLRPFLATDATNIWSTAMLISNDRATATNNVCLVSEACSLLDGTGIPMVAIPGYSMDEIIRMGVEPSSFGVSENSITFYFEDLWIKSQLIVAPWPSERIEVLMKSAPKKIATVPNGFKEAVQKIIPFCKDPKFPVIITSASGVATEDFDHQAEVSGIELPEMRFNAAMLKLVLERADRFTGGKDQKAYFGIENATGILMALRQ